MSTTLAPSTPQFSEAQALQGFLWTWGEFNAQVDALCPLEKTRTFGDPLPDGSSQYYRKSIRQAIIDLQHFVPSFTDNHETIYFNQDFADDGQAHVGNMPPNSQVRSCWYYCAQRKIRIPVQQIPWERRFDMASGRCWDNMRQSQQLTAATSASLDAVRTAFLLDRGFRQNQGIIAMSPGHERFYILPKIEGSMVFSIFWDGQKNCWRDNELVVFDDEVAQAAADWVKSDFAGYVERDPQRKAMYMQDYVLKRSNIFTRQQAKGFIK